MRRLPAIALATLLVVGLCAGAGAAPRLPVARDRLAVNPGLFLNVLPGRSGNDDDNRRRQPGGSSRDAFLNVSS